MADRLALAEAERAALESDLAAERVARAMAESELQVVEAIRGETKQLAAERDEARASAASRGEAAGRAARRAADAEAALQLRTRDRDALRTEAADLRQRVAAMERALDRGARRKIGVAAAREEVTTWAGDLDSSGAAAVRAALGHLRAAEKGRRPDPLPKIASATLSEKSITAATAVPAAPPLPETRPVEEVLAAIAVAVEGVERSASGWLVRVRGTAASTGAPTAAVAAGLAAEFAAARRGNLRLGRQLDELDSRISEFAAPARRLAAAVARDDRVDRSELARIIRIRGELVERLECLPPPAGGGAARHKALGAYLHPRLLSPAEPRSGDAGYGHHKSARSQGSRARCNRLGPASHPGLLARG